MNAVRCIACLVVAFIGSLSAGCGDRLTEYTNDEGRFRVRLPGTPSPVEGKGEQAVVHGVRLSQQSGNYTVTWEDIDRQKTGKSDDELLDLACAAALARVKGKELSRKAIELDGHPGRDLVTEWSDGKGIVQDRMYLVDGRLYHVVASGARWWVESSTSRKVLGSFAVVEE